MIAINGFRAASMTKWSSMKSQMDCVHSSGNCLLEIQWRLDWHCFLDGCPHEQLFPVAIVMKRSSRTLVDSQPLEVYASIVSS